MTYRVSLENPDDETIEDTECETWKEVHAAIDQWHSDVQLRDCYLLISAFERRTAARANFEEGAIAPDA
jgi:hypothetical protein